MSVLIDVRVGSFRHAIRVTGVGPSLVLLHGGGPGTSSTGWCDVAEHLASKWRVFSPDHLGFGASEAPDLPYGTPFYVERLAALLDTLYLGRVPVVGHSMGAQVAMRLALSAPGRVTHLGLVSPGGGSFGLEYSSAGITAVGDYAASPSEAAMRKVVALMHAPNATGLEAEVARRMETMRLPGLLAAQRALVASRQAQGGPNAVTPALEAAGIPMLLLWGEAEQFNPPHLGPAIRQALPAGARYESVADAGHNLPEEQPDRIAAAIASFVSQS